MKLSDLNFETHAAGSEAFQAIVFFDNGFGASIITGELFYTRSDAPYELAILQGTEDGWKLTYDTEITDDVMGYLTESGVNEVLKKIELLTKMEKNNNE